MSIARDPALAGLTDCGCCDGTAVATPQPLDNRPGLGAVAYRMGTHPQFLRSLLSRLSDSDHPQLRALSTRDNSDPTIALLDACATVDDILTFYQERYANEGYLRTATERVSLLQLARLIGYEARPGVAASAYLAFTIEDTPGSPEETTIDQHTRVQSMPGKDELPQSFETEQAITARRAWNALRVRTKQPQILGTAMQQAVVAGLESGIKRGDSVLIVAGGATTDRAVKRVQRVTPDPATGTTLLELAAPPPPASTTTLGATSGLNFTLALTLQNAGLGQLFGGGTVFNQGELAAFTQVQGWAGPKFAAAVNAGVTPPPSLPAPTLGLFALRQRAAIFGHNAPKWADLPQIVQGKQTQIPGRLIDAGDLAGAQYPTDWDNFSLSQSPGGANTIDLDNTYPAMSEETWVVLEQENLPAAAYRIAKNAELTRTDYALSAKVTRLTLDGNTNFSTLTMRNTAVLGQSELLPLASVAVSGPLTGDTITLDRYVDRLVPGQLIVVSGVRVDLAGVADREVHTLADVIADGALEPGRVFTRLVLQAPLAFAYDPETVTINANVVLATHGETKGEVLGSGDGSQRYQRFPLRHAPLTYTSAATPAGVENSLEVRVNDVRWREVPSLFGLPPDDRAYVVRTEDDGKSQVQFNAPLPTGQENVSARYRVGIGSPGLVHADRLTLLAQRPLGVRGVTNPLPAGGGEDREGIDGLRRNGPLTVLTFDRLVSLRDYEDFALAFPGFGKALATPTSERGRQGVFLTVAAAGGGALIEGDPVFGNLVGAIARFGDPFVPFVVKPYRPAFFRLDASIGIDPAYIVDQVLAAVEALLRVHFSFDQRQFGQPVRVSELIAAMQGVPGVVFIDLNGLYRTGTAASLNQTLVAALPQPGATLTGAQAAELLLLDPTPLQLGVISV